MDKIWYRNPSKSGVIGRCGGDEEKRMTTQNRQKSNALKKPDIKLYFIHGPSDCLVLWSTFEN